MEIRQLRYFIAVADTLNFSRAAESVYLSQPALSRQIMDLEQEVGLPLLNRNTRQVELTAAGRALQRSAKELISRWEKMLPEIWNQVEEEATALTLTIGFDARALAKPDRRLSYLSALYDLRRSYPGLRILVRNNDYQELIKGISDHTIDCALVFDRALEKKSDICQETFSTEEMVLVFRSENLHQPQDYADIIMNRGLILVDTEQRGLYHIVHILSDLKLEPQIRFCESLDDMTMMIEIGESAAILPESVVAKLDNPLLQVLHLPTEYAKMYLTLLWPKKQTNSMVEQVRDRFKALEDQNQI